MATADPPWLPGCKAELAQIPGGVLCAQNHCDDANNYLHAVCYCQAPYKNGCSGGNTPGCCSYSATSPVIIFNSDGTNCYCCCGCFANETEVAFSVSQTKPVSEYVPGEALWVAMDVQLSSWAAVPVVFSAGTGPDSENGLLRLSFETPADEDEDGLIYVTREQVLMVEGNLLKRAKNVVPGSDRLMKADGATVGVLDLTAGDYKQGVHQISTSDGPTFDPNGHLIVANGLVCGDYSLQVTDLDAAMPELMVPGHADLPEFGTKEYGEAYTHLLADSFRAHPPERVLRESDPGVFEPFYLQAAPAVPSDARSLFTEKQAKDIQKNAPQYPIISGAGNSIINYLFKLYKGFYPTVVFYLDNTNELPNVYAFRQYGTTFVIVNGGFIRTKLVQFESIAFGIAQALGHLFGGEPESKDGYTCTGAADYAAILAVFPYVWFGQYAQRYITAAIPQVQLLFDAISPANRGGKPGDTCVFISTECRTEALHAAAGTASLPQCAGGPPPATLAVTGAIGGEDATGTYVKVTFSEPVDPKTAAFVGSYEFKPIAPATAAALEAGTQDVVIIHAALTKGKEYTVRAIEVTSANGNPMIPSRSRATFTVEED